MEISFQEIAIESIVKECYGRSVAAGWHTDLETGKPRERNVGEMIALIHSELSEALEGARKGLPSEKIAGFSNEEEEMADALIRIADYAGTRNLRLAQAYVAKLAYNAQRADHKIENRRAEGGKKF